jgi:hypothetical protein
VSSYATLTVSYIIAILKISPWQLNFVSRNQLLGPDWGTVLRHSVDAMS